MIRLALLVLAVFISLNICCYHYGGHIMGILSGKKTYVLAVIAILTGIAQYLTGDATIMDALNYAWAGGVAAALRAGVGTIEAKVAK